MGAVPSTLASIRYFGNLWKIRSESLPAKPQIDIKDKKTWHLKNDDCHHLKESMVVIAFHHKKQPKAFAIFATEAGLNRWSRQIQVQHGHELLTSLTEGTLRKVGVPENKAKEAIKTIEQQLGSTRCTHWCCWDCEPIWCDVRYRSFRVFATSYF